ncbi:hypothetical protein SLEP1_g37556 [Rubroshorea leprosula]|uniref:DUF674 domain-containing protein n=1 Tax=Rubroshorea leprosula TaxID=152421 RepID=A0AAV5KUZ5_9ROSI|nr:hypothetical protein SLEP1_g37556 [Rubroshorea leprosula]
MVTTQKTVSLKLLVDSKGHRVLFAETGKDFVDFLFNLLSLPVGMVIRLLSKQGMIGSLACLYDGVENLSDPYMLPSIKKDDLLKPRFVLQVQMRLFFCQILSHQLLLPFMHGCSTYKSITVFVEPQKRQSSSSEEQGGFVKGVGTYMVTDNLEVRPMSMISSISTLNKFNVKEVGSLKEKGVKLLQASLQSKTVLTDVFLGKKV